MKEYFLSFVGVLFLSCFVELLSSNTKFKPYISLLCGTVIVIAMIGPITEIYSGIEVFIEKIKFAPKTTTQNEEPIDSSTAFDETAYKMSITNAQTEIEERLKEKFNVDSKCKIELNLEEDNKKMVKVYIYTTDLGDEKEIKTFISDFYSLSKNNIYVTKVSGNEL